MWTYVCIYVCMCVYLAEGGIEAIIQGMTMHVSRLVCSSRSLRTYAWCLGMCVCLYLCGTCIFIYIYIYIHTHIHTYSAAWLWATSHGATMYIHTHTYIHTYTHSHTQCGLALGDLAWSNDANQARVGRAGGIPPIIAGMHAHPTHSGTQGGLALGNLASLCVPNRRLIAQVCTVCMCVCVYVCMALLCVPNRRLIAQVCTVCMYACMYSCVYVCMYVWRRCACLIGG